MDSGQRVLQTGCMQATVRTCGPIAGFILALILYGVSMPTAAAGLWRCQGSQGEMVFTSRTTGYGHCRRVYVFAQSPGRSARSPDRRLASAKQRRTSSTTKPILGGRKTDHKHRIRPHPVILRGTVYRITHTNGSVEYTNLPGTKAGAKRVQKLFSYFTTCYACGINSTINWHTTPLRLHAYQQAIHSAAKRWRLDPALLQAIIHAESAFNPYAVSAKGAAGLMQLMPDTAVAMGVAHVFNPQQNIAGGARYLALLLTEFGGKVSLAAAAYNAGSLAVKKYAGIPPYPETRVYVKRVSILQQRYDQAAQQSSWVTSGHNRVD